LAHRSEQYFTTLPRTRPLRLRLRGITFSSHRHSWLISGLAVLTRIVYTIAMQTSKHEDPHRNLDLVSQDGTALRRGYIEIIFDRYYGTELTAAQQESPAFLVTLFERNGAREQEIGQRVFPTTLPATIPAELRKTIIKRAANKLTDELGVSAFSTDIDQWNDEWAKFAEFAQDAEVAWFLP